MGLDMYLYRLSKPKKTVKELNEIHYNKMSDQGFIVFLAKNLPPDFELIRPYAKKVNILVDFIDLQKIKKDFHITRGFSQICGESYSAQETGYSFYNPITHKVKDVKISNTDMDAKYTITKRAEAYCIEIEHEIGYWRKQYTISNAMNDASDTPIQNCGYYPLTKKMWNTLRSYDEATYDRAQSELARAKEKQNASVIVYHEWY